MEIVTHDDTESIKFIHGPRFKPCNNKAARILICNPLKYLIIEKGSQIIIFDLDVIISNPDGLAYFESNLGEFSHAQLGIYSINNESSITHMILDFSNTILTVVVEKKILLFDLINIDKKSEWISINHNGIKSITWTRSNDIITIETDGLCHLYHISSNNVSRTELILDNNSDKFALVEACKSNLCGIELILITEIGKNIIFVTNELYNQIIFSQSKSFTITKSFIKMFSTMIEPMLDIFPNDTSKLNIVNRLHIASAKFIDGNDIYLSITLIGGFEYLDGYVLFFSIDSDLNVSLASYSINDICFDNIDPNDIDQIKQISCASIWVQEWKILFIGSSVFSQMVLFTCDHSYLNKENLIEYTPHKWIRLAMCEGYDINCTDFDVGIFDSCLFTCNSKSIRDPKLTIDSPEINEPPIIFIAETNGNIITHYICGNAQLIRPIKSEKLDSLIALDEALNKKSSEKRDVKVQDQVPALTALKYSAEPSITNVSNISNNATLYDPIHTIKQVFMAPKDRQTNQESTIINKSEGKLLDSIMKVESQVLQLEKKFLKINDKVFGILKSPIFQSLTDFCKFVNETKPASNECVDFYQLVSKFNEISNIEIHLRRLQFYFVKKISNEIYKNTKIEILKEKLRKNELTSSQISILFQFDTELFGIFADYGIDVNQEILSSLISAEKLSLKLASRISQVSKFCDRLNYRKINDREFTLLPPSEYNKILQDTNQSYATPNKNPDSHTISSQKIVTSSGVRILKKRNPSSQSDSKGKYRISSLKKDIRLSEIINNISNSVINDDTYIQTLNATSSSRIMNTQNLKINNFVSQTNTPGRYFQIRSKSVGYSFNNNRVFYKELGTNKHSAIQDATPFFTQSWTPGLTEESIGSFKLTEYSNQELEINNKHAYPIKLGNSNSILSSCFERLERIIDHCEIANGSISFIEREELLPTFIKKIEKDSSQNLENPNTGISRGNRVITSQLLLSRNSSLQKNMAYRQKLSLIISGLINSQSGNKPNGVLQRMNNLYNFDVGSRDNYHFNQDQSWENNLKSEHNMSNCSSLQSGKDQNFIPFNFETSPLEHNVCSNKNHLSSGPVCTTEKLEYSDPGYANTVGLGNKADLHQDYVSKPSIYITNKHDINIGNSEAKTLENFVKITDTSSDEQKMNERSKNLGGGSSNTGEFTNSSSISKSLDETAVSSTSDNGNFIVVENNQLTSKEIEIKPIDKSTEPKNDNYEKPLLQSIFSDTLNSQKASECLFTFSSEMNTSIDLIDPQSKKNPENDQISDSNTYSSKPIDNVCTLTKQNSVEGNSLSNASMKSILNKTDELSVPNDFAINCNTNSIIESKDTSFRFQDTNINGSSEPNFGTHSTTPNSLGGVFNIPNILASMNSAPRISGFGSSQFLTSGPFSSNDGDGYLCANTKNQNAFEEPQLLGLPTANLNASTPYKSYPSSDNSTGGFATLSSEFHGFSSVNTQNSMNSSFSANTSNIFNFAPPQKPRQVNKLD